MMQDIGPQEAAALMPKLTAIVARACVAILGLRMAAHRAKSGGSPVTNADGAVIAWGDPASGAGYF